MAIFAGGIYLAVTGDRYAVLTGSSYVAGAALIIICGLVTIATSVVGLVGAIGQFRWILLIVSPHHTLTSICVVCQPRPPSPPLMQFSAIVAVIIILELAAGIYGFVRRDELVSPAHKKFSCHGDLNPLLCQQVTGSSTVRTHFLNAVDSYLPEANADYQSSINVAVDFVQDSVSGWGYSKEEAGLC